MRFLFCLSQYECTELKLYFKMQKILHFSFIEIFTEKIPDYYSYKIITSYKLSTRICLCGRLKTGKINGTKHSARKKV